jgi:hypothetical protein
MRSRLIGLLLAAAVAGAIPTVAVGQLNSPYTALNLPQGQLNGQQTMQFLLASPILGPSYIYTYRANGTWEGVARRGNVDPPTVGGSFQISAAGVITRIDRLGNVRTYTIIHNGNWFYRFENGESERIEAAAN